MKGLLPAPAKVLLKLGGSLLADIESCRQLANVINSASHLLRIIVFPGGGPIDNYIEDIDKQLSFPPLYHHNLCARAQDQTGLMFASMCSNAAFFSTPQEARGALESGRLAIMLPSRMILELDVFEQTWEVTSDFMSAWFAELFGVERFAILTNVDGYYVGGPEVGELVPEISASRLIGLGRTCVDECTPPFLHSVGRRCDVLNGINSHAVSDWLHNDICHGTRIMPE
jgi:hypothetical protein